MECGNSSPLLDLRRGYAAKRLAPVVQKSQSGDKSPHSRCESFPSLPPLRHAANALAVVVLRDLADAVAWVLRAEAAPDTLDLICLSGRGDKDLAEVLPKLGIGL